MNNDIEFIFNMIEDLKSISSSLSKKDYLSKIKNTKIVCEYFKLALDKQINFYIKKIPEFANNNYVEKSFSNMISILKKLSNREVTGNKAIDLVSNFLSHCNEKEIFVFTTIIEKNPRCGVNKKFFNSVFGDNILSEEIKLCKAMPYNEKNIKYISFPCFSQKKCDGARAIAIKKDGEVKIYSSGNKEFNKLNKIKNIIKNINIDNFILDGELLVFNSNSEVELSRKEGNGILNKSVQNTISEEESNNIRMIVWDIESLSDYNNDKSSITYDKVMEKLNKYIGNKYKEISIVETRIVNDFNEAFNHFKEMTENGFEGTIIKNKNTKWENKRIHDCVKFKIEIITTLKVDKVLEGEGKFKNNTGSIICSSKEGKVVVGVSGYTDEERKYFWENRKNIIGTLFDIKSNGIIFREDGSYSLFLPRFVEIREKPEGADTFEYICNQCSSSILLKEKNNG